MSLDTALGLLVCLLDIIQISHSATSPPYLCDTEDALRPPHMQMHIPQFNLFSPFFQCHMQNRPAAADAGLSAGVINTNMHGTKYRPHSLAYKTSAHNAKICGEKFTALFQIHTHRNMSSRTCRCDTESSFAVHFAYLNLPGCDPAGVFVFACVSLRSLHVCKGNIMHKSANIRSWCWYLHGKPDALMLWDSFLVHNATQHIVQKSTGARGAACRSSHPS